MHIREATSADADLVLGWMNNKAIWAVDNPDPYEPKSIEVFRPQWDRVVHQNSTWVVEIDGEPVGHLGWISCPQDLAEFFIVIGENKVLGRGIGKKAMTWLFRTAEAQGIDALYGRVLGNNPHALGFFGNLGFVEMGRTEAFFERGGLQHDLHWIQRQTKEGQTLGSDPRV